MEQKNRNRRLIIFAVMATVLFAMFLLNDNSKSVGNKNLHKLSAVIDLTSGNIKPIQLYKGDEEYIHYSDDSVLRISSLASADDAEIICSITIMKMRQEKYLYLLKPIFRADLKGIVEEGELIPGDFSVIPCNSVFEVLEVRSDNVEKLIEDSGINGNLDVEWYNPDFAIRDSTKFQVKMTLKDIKTKRVEVSLSH